MKNFHFKQENDFGDTLSMNVVAETKEAAEQLIYNYIAENTENETTRFKSELAYLKGLIKDYKDHPSKTERMFSFLGGSFSIKDIEEDENLRMKIAAEASKRTYIWYFKNKPFSLEEINKKEGVYDVTFTYTGR